jgi:competence protein ComEA
MRHRFTFAQKIVLALCVLALILGVFIGYQSGPADDAATGEQEVTYTLPDDGGVPITVHVVGAVQRPGLYSLTSGSRVRDAILHAGGFRSDADAQSVNLAAFVDDGDQVRVEAKPRPEPEAASAPPPVTSQPRPAQAPAASSHAAPTRSTRASRPRPKSRAPAVAARPSRQTDRSPAFTRSPRSRQVRINRAGLDELQRIPGVGPETARNIIYHRSLHGPFRSFTALDDVPGIGPATIEKIRVSATLH